MKKFADLTSEAKESLMNGDWTKLGQLMDSNFETRKSIYGEECLGQKNLKMIEIARKFGAHCKFPGNLMVLFFYNPYTYTYFELESSDMESYNHTNFYPFYGNGK